MLKEFTHTLSRRHPFSQIVSLFLYHCCSMFFMHSDVTWTEALPLLHVLSPPPPAAVFFCLALIELPTFPLFSPLDWSDESAAHYFTGIDISGCLAQLS